MNQVKIVKSLFSVAVVTALGILSSNAIASEAFVLDNSEKRTTIQQKKAVTKGWLISGLYVAYFKRAPDYEGLKFWGDKVDVGVEEGESMLNILKELSSLFAEHPVFASIYDELDDDEFVSKIYTNVLGSRGDSEGIGFWIAQLERGVSRSDMVASFVEATLTSELTSEEFPNLEDYELTAAQRRQDLLLNKALVGYYFATKLKEKSNIGSEPSRDVSQKATQYKRDKTDIEKDLSYQGAQKILENVKERKTASMKIKIVDRLLRFDNPMDRYLNDETPPEITLNGGSKITLRIGEEYIEEGAVAVDDIDGGLDVIIGGDEIDSDVARKYKITYTAVDESGNESMVEREVEVLSDSPTPLPSCPTGGCTSG